MRCNVLPCRLLNFQLSIIAIRPPNLNNININPSLKAYYFITIHLSQLPQYIHPICVESVVILELKMKHENADVLQIEWRKSEVKIKYATTYLDTIIHFFKVGIGAGE